MIREAMTEVAEALAGHTVHRVTTDPRNANGNCMLVDIPEILPEQTTECDARLLRHRVLCIGRPGAWAELGVLDALVEDALAVIDTFESCEPVAFVPLQAASEGDAVQAYRITFTAYYPMGDTAL